MVVVAQNIKVLSHPSKPRVTYLLSLYSRAASEFAGELGLGSFSSDCAHNKNNK